RPCRPSPGVGRRARTDAGCAAVGGLHDRRPRSRARRPRGRVPATDERGPRTDRGVKLDPAIDAPPARAAQAGTPARRVGDPAAGANAGDRRSGFRTLLHKEVLRFRKVSFQTIAAPILTGVLYLLVFGHVLEAHVEAFPGVSYTAFLIPGLVMM